MKEEVKLDTYIKKPILIVATQWLDDQTSYFKLVKMGAVPHIEITGDGNLYIKTLEGRMKCPVGAYVIKGIKGEFYSCAEEIFNESYEKAGWDNE